ncbi:hypothetical protein M3665_25325, partial [Bacillus licheniformis]|nr:hypothetical protein [Bacillus licheniformis]
MGQEKNGQATEMRTARRMGFFCPVLPGRPHFSTIMRWNPAGTTEFLAQRNVVAVLQRDC